MFALSEARHQGLSILIMNTLLHERKMQYYEGYKECDGLCSDETPLQESSGGSRRMHMRQQKIELGYRRQQEGTINKCPR